MPRFPAELPKGPPEPWWQTTSIAELENAAAVIEEFTRESNEPPPSVSREAFARAMALQMLCVDEGVLDAVIDRVDEVSDGYRPELRPGGDRQRQSAFGAWVTRSEEIARGLLRCAELLPEALRNEKGDALESFLRRVEDHICAHIEFMFHRRAVAIRRETRKRPKRS